MFVVCGEALFDVFLEPTADRSATSLALNALAGGSPFNVAIGLARLGNPVAMLTGLSTDFLGERLAAILQAEHVSTRFIARKPAPTTLSLIQLNATGVPEYAFYGNGAADRLLDENDIKIDLDGVTGLHLGSYSLVVEPASSAYLSLLRQQAGKCIISIDPNIRLNVEPDRERWRQRLAEVLPIADVVKVSDEDLHLLYPEQTAESIVTQWLKQGVKLLVLTRGSAGASLWSQQARVDIAAATIDLVDTVGAGDTFQTALIDAVTQLQQADPQHWETALTITTLEQMGRFATTAAGITCSRRGADLPTRAEVIAQLESKDKFK